MSSDKKTVILLRDGVSVTLTPPLGLMSLAAELGDHGFRPRLFDLSAEPGRRPELGALIAERRALWLGLTAMSPEIPQALKIIEQVRGLDRGLPIVLGGPHASALPERSLREFGVDAVCVGPGEETAVEISRMAAAGQKEYWRIPGVGALDDSGAYRFGDLDEARLLRPPRRPDWDQINLGAYQGRAWQFIHRREIVAPFYTTRGCPFSCSFCAAGFSDLRKISHRPPVEVVDEIEFLKKERGAEEFHLVDDNFNVDLGYAKSVLRELALRKLDIVWKTPNGIWLHSQDEQWLDLLVETGCYQVGFGIESGASEVLKKNGKKIRLEQAAEILQRYRSRGISTFGFFILGLPGETRRTIARTIDFAASAPLDHVHVSLLAPYPGSKIYCDLEKEGRAPTDWTAFDHYAGFELGELNRGELRRSLIRFYARFYARPDRALRLARDIFGGGGRQFVRLAGKIIRG